MYKYFIAALFCFFSMHWKLTAQCCSAGSGSPIAGGTSQGVLAKGQAEINVNYQNLSTRKFLTGDAPAKDFLNRFYSNYSYLRLSYGLTKELTISVESGYYLNRSQIGLDNKEIKSSGIADLIIFPRYMVFNRTKKAITTELTLGLGYKIPIGSYQVNVKETEPFSGEVYYYRAPPAVQPTTGSQDIIFYSFFYRNYTLKKLKVFANALYIKKGWNPLGEKFGDYASVSLFASKTFWRKLGVTLQVKGEWIDKMKYNFDVYQAGKYNYDPEATGSKAVFVTPQLSYTVKDNLTFFVLKEIPVYQFVSSTQIAAQHITTAGIAYRFNLKDCTTEE